MRLNYSACCLVFSCFFICISFPTFAQEAFRHPAEVIKSIKPSVEEVPYAFAVADRVQIAISNGCPVVVGVVEAIDDNQLSLTIQDEFSGSGNERGRIPVSLNGYKRRGGTPNSSSPWRDV